MRTGRPRALRHAETPAERRLWQMLRGLKPLAFHFRRQVPIGKYFADFASHHARLIIEVDGDTHGTDAAESYDRERDAFLRAAGYEVLRLSNRDVMHNPDGVGTMIMQALEGRAVLPTPTRLPPPSPQGGGAIDLTTMDSLSPDSSLTGMDSLPLEGRDAGRQGGGRAIARHGAGHRAFKDLD